jgi:hypothetical protein
MSLCPLGSDLTLNDVETINDREEMFGIGTRANGEDRAFFLIPCQEGEQDCIDASESAAVASRNELLVTKGRAQLGTTRTAMTAAMVFVAVPTITGTCESYVSNEALLRQGKKMRRRHVADVVIQLRAAP